MNIYSNNRFIRRYKIVNVGITRPSANDESCLIIDANVSLSAAERSALRSDFENLAPVIAINKKVFRSEPVPN